MNECYTEAEDMHVLLHDGWAVCPTCVALHAFVLYLLLLHGMLYL